MIHCSGNKASREFRLSLACLASQSGYWAAIERGAGRKRARRGRKFAGHAPQNKSLETDPHSRIHGSQGVAAIEPGYYLKDLFKHVAKSFMNAGIELDREFIMVSEFQSLLLIPSMWR